MALTNAPGTVLNTSGILIPFTLNNNPYKVGVVISISLTG